MPSVWGFYPRFERSRGLNAKGLQSLGNSPGRGIVTKAVGIGLGDFAYLGDDGERENAVPRWSWFDRGGGL
jgi:hypothetical protein